MKKQNYQQPTIHIVTVRLQQFITVSGGGGTSGGGGNTITDIDDGNDDPGFGGGGNGDARSKYNGMGFYDDSDYDYSGSDDSWTDD